MAKKREGEPKPPAGAPERPEWLLGDAAIGEWNRLVEVLSAMGVLTKADSWHLGALADSHALYRMAIADIAENGIRITTPNGCPVQNPAVGTRN